MKFHLSKKKKKITTIIEYKSWLIYNKNYGKFVIHVTVLPLKKKLRLLLITLSSYTIIVTFVSSS